MKPLSYFLPALLAAALSAQTVTVTPANPYVGVNSKTQFSAAVKGLSNTAVTWSLIGMGTNNPKLGTITAAGLYTAPATPPAQNPITVVATASDGKTTGTTYVLIEPLGPTVTSVLPNPVPTGNFTITVNGSGFLSGAVVTLGGIALPTTVVSSTQLSAGGWWGTTGQVAVSVKNPGTLTSNTVEATFATPITVSPATASVALGTSKTFSASVANVTWSATAGTITSAGVYTAPSTMPSSAAVTITASAGGLTGTAKVTLTQPVSSVDPPTFTPPAGTYTSAQSVTLASATSGASIRYTTDGSTPSETAGTLYSTGFSVGATTTVKAIAYKAGSSDSAVATAVYTINLPAITISVSPTAASLSASQTQSFTATVANTSNLGVNWTLSGAGSLSSATSTSGTAITYTAPSSIAAKTTVTLTAASAASSAKTAVATITLNPPSAITVSPSTATVALGGTQTFTAQGQSSVTWSASAGTITSAGVYTAPSTMPSSSTVTITATGSGNQTGTATVTLAQPVTISVSPTTASLSASQTQSFTATVANSSNLGVNWTLTGAGSLSAATSTSGTAITYTAPSSVAAKTTVTLTAASAASSSKTAVATITLNPPVNGPITVSPSTVTVALGGTQTFTASGQASVTWSATAGTITTAGVFTAPATMTQTGIVTVTATGAGSQSASATVTLSNPTAQVTAAAAQRFLEQAAYGPSPASIASVQAAGFQGWLNQQFALGQISNYDNLSASMTARFLTNAVMNQDQLRQRVAFALSQIDVVSLNSLIFPGNVTPYEDLLLSDAFTNYRQILNDVTLSPSMGAFLNMVNNATANPALGTVANENYARELMQLFSIGTVMLNQDGSVQTGSDGLPIATYNQTNVTELARVLTGWTFAQTAPNPPNWGAGINDGNTDVTSPMVVLSQYHDPGSKTLLPDYEYHNGSVPYVAPAGLTPAQDLSAALDNVFYHPNVGPFIGKQLIQHLVKSNPSPAYISRVAAAFANNGQGVRGDMKAVISAVLLDPEARANDAGGLDQPTDGHMQEPAVFLAGLIRAFNGTVNDQNYFSYDLANMNQDIFNAPSVFNYYAPNYQVPQTTLTGGEFQIFDTYTSIYRANLVSGLFGNFSDPVQTYGPGTTIDLTPYMSLSKNAPALVNAMDAVLTRGMLPAAVKTAIATAVAAEDPAGYTGGLKQVQTALYLIATSNYYNVWH